MRNAFVNSLISCAQQDDRVALLMAEVGFSVVEPFEARFPNRFFNTGIAEQSLVATAAGMAVAGLRPVAYSMSAFLPSRAYEQIKVSVCYQNLPVTLVAVGAGLSYGEMGATHHASEEAAIMQSLPNMTTIFPSDATEISAALEWSFQQDGPVYISFPKAPNPTLPEHAVTIGKAVRYRTGADGAIIAVGYMVKTALEVQSALQKEGLSLSVYGLHTTKPLDKAAIAEALGTKNVFVIDEHLPCTGPAIASSILSMGKPIQRYIDFSLPDAFADTVMRHDELLAHCGLTASSITQKILEAYRQ